MSRLSRCLVTSASAVVASLLVAGPSYAGGGLQHCLNKAIDHGGDPPICTKVNGTWVASWPDDPSGSSGIPGAFVLLFVLALVVGVAVTIWKVTTARRLAEQSGMDPGLATTMTLLTDDGLDATYLAANLRGQTQSAATSKPRPSPSAETMPSASKRLEELKGLLDRGLVTQAEYDERRKAIIDAV